MKAEIRKPKGTEAGSRWLPRVNSAEDRFRFRISRPRAAFTLIEMMVVLGIIAILATLGLPSFFRAFHRDALRQATSDIAEVCSNARARAILSGEPAEVVIRPQARQLSVGGAAPPARATRATPATPARGGLAAEAVMPRPGSGLSATWPDSLVLQMLDVNFVEYKDAEEARVRFYPNGTCDELRIVLLSDKGEQRGVMLELTTGLAEVATADDIRGWLKE